MVTSSCNLDFSWIFDGIRLDRLASAGSGRSGRCWRREGSAGVEVFKIFIGANKCEGAMLMKSLISWGRPCKKWRFSKRKSGFALHQTFYGGDFKKKIDFMLVKMHALCHF